jgi:hypothetical protein
MATAAMMRSSINEEKEIDKSVFVEPDNDV